jgi:hypothetical protein
VFASIQKTGRGMVFLIACRRCKKLFIFHAFSGIGFPVRDPRKTSLSFLRCLPSELDEEWIS